MGFSNKEIQENTQNVKDDAMSLAKKMEHLELSKRKLLGDGLDTCSSDELHQIENQLERSLNKIRARKDQLLWEQIKKLREDEKCLLEENKNLWEQYRIEKQRLSRKQQGVELVKETSDEVETELFIGPPERRMA